MANIVGGYAILDITDIVAAGESGLSVPNWNNDLKRIKSKPVWMKWTVSSKEYACWCSVSETAGAYGLTGIAFIEGAALPVAAYTEDADTPTVIFMIFEGE